ncbi:hypothetical protein FEM48_Zijuj07G0060200 [Ziziphus jujuba var. spinosa]|uniref:Rab-GAP TBC domain-containing protein n=1 Tax=Ziziphus jujuba var. spinosa TaxID=714518 RepID=A0A978V2W3_ZIZJJ|nr:hypothetical protein FEM48_Zijuj07G0060200 [Ziziphus jujuba var. spinosa]
MVKKKVPDWLNSSLWSTTPSSNDDHSLQYASKPSPTATSAASAGYDVSEPPAVDPPVPVPPPSVVVERESPKPETQDSNPSYEDNSNGVSSTPSAEEISRQAQLLTELSRKVINMHELRKIASQGIPDGAGIRSTVWKLLLGYLPPDRSLWSTELAKKRSQYKHFKDELLMNPTDELEIWTAHCWQSQLSLLVARRLFSWIIFEDLRQSEITRKLEKSTIYDNDESKCERRGLLSRSHITHGEHPLSLGKTSVWNQFFQDSEIIEQIDRDVKRTHPDFNFFSGDSQFAKSNQEALKSVLIVFAKLNPGIRYVQGMNEILAPLFYVFRNDPDEETAGCAEADTFFCFVELLSGFRDHFCQQLDNSVVGIRSTITKLSQLLKEHDEELWRHLEVTTKVNPQFYAFRWITLLLTQEFNFADSLHIWDTLLSDPEGPQVEWFPFLSVDGTFDFAVVFANSPLASSSFAIFFWLNNNKETLLRICCAMLILIRRRLLAGDFTSNLKLLQNYPPTNISHLLYVANKLRLQSSG